ncbi:hypothetical protein AAG906_026696 [Vitis piasezkii]
MNSMNIKSKEVPKDVLMVGICGLGGVSKSTMVKAIYNKLSNQFKGKSFLDKGGDVSKGYHGINVLKDMLWHKKFLLVIDDVNDKEQLENLAEGHDWFGEGSRIFITSRNKSLLARRKVDELYELPQLNWGEALELFSWHAFDRRHPYDDFYTLSKRFLRYCQGLPLALKTLGSSLFKMQPHEWESELRKLEEEPNMEILDVLKVGMHNLIQQLGHKIVRDEGLRNKGMRSRLWDHMDVKDVLKKMTGTNSIEGIFLNLSKLNNINLTTPAMKEMTELRLLKIFLGSEVVSGEEDYKVCISSDFEFPSWDLCYLYWHGYPLNSLPSNFEVEKLVELSMPYSNIRKFGEGNMIGPSIGDLERLGLLDLKECKSLGSLPDSICNLKSLKTLYLSGCSELNGLPKDLGNMTHLTEFYANRTTTGAPPPAICCLREFLILLFSGFKGGRTYPSLSSLSASITELSRLKVLVLGRCKRLQSLPKLPPRLEELDAHECVSLQTSLVSSSDVVEGTSRMMSLHKTILERIQHAPKSQFCILVPGDKVPAWFQYCVEKSLLTIRPDIDWCDDGDSVLGICVCFFFAFKDQLPQIHDDISCRLNKFSFFYPYRDKGSAYQPCSGFDICHPETWRDIEASFELSDVTDASEIECGIHLIYKPRPIF